MRPSIITAKYALLGKNLELKENVKVHVDEHGVIGKILSENPSDFQLNKLNREYYILLPSFINSHIHIADSFAKEMGYNMDLIDVVAPPNGLKHKLLRENNVSNQFKIDGIKNAVKEMISCGTTYFCDFREEGIKGVTFLNSILKNLQIRSKIFGRFSNQEEISLVYKKADGIGLASYSSIADLTKGILKKLKENNPKLITCHLAELKRNPERINDLLNDKLVDIIIHGTHLIKEDLTKLHKNGISIVLCPRSNAYFGVGIPPIIDILKQKIPISLGTDNVMVNNLDLFEELRFLYKCIRLYEDKNDKLNISGRELLSMVTINPARQLGLENKVGSISEGNYADVMKISLIDPNYYSFLKDPSVIYSLIVQRTKPENIKDIYIGGNKVFSRN